MLDIRKREMSEVFVHDDPKTCRWRGCLNLRHDSSFCYKHQKRVVRRRARSANG